MKSTILLMALTACGALAGTATTTPCATAPIAPRHSVELGIPVLAAANELATGINHIDVAGLDLTYVYNLTPEHGLFVRVAGLNGSEEVDGYVGGNHVYHQEIEVSNYSLMVGYRFTKSVAEKTSLFAAAGVGVARTEVEFEQFNAGEFVDGTIGHDGVAYSLECGAKYQVTPHTSLFAAYEFYGSNSKPQGTKTQLYNGVRFGVGYSF